MSEGSAMERKFSASRWIRRKDIKFVSDSFNLVFEKVEKALRKIDQRKDCWKRRWLFVSEYLVSHTEQLFT